MFSHLIWSLLMKLQEFAAGLYAGKLPLYFKSQPVPAEVRRGCLLVLWPFLFVCILAIPQAWACIVG